MTRYRGLYLLIILLSLTAIPLLAQEVPTPQRNLMDEGKAIFDLVYTAEWDLIDYINWEEFYLNDNYIGEIFLIDYENGEEEICYEETLEDIYDLFRTEGYEKETFGDWKETLKGMDYILQCSSSKYKVAMYFEVMPSVLYMYKLEIEKTGKQ